MSRGVAYELQELERTMGIALPPEALIGEALRIVARKRESGGGRESERTTKVAFENWLRKDKVSLNELAEELIVANEIAAALDMAEGRPVRPQEITTP